MKKNLLILSLTLLYLAKSYGQLADITYSIQTGNIKSYENDCWEAGTEEYTGYLDSWDDVNSTWVGTGCQTCDNNGNCTYASDIALQTRSNNAYTVTFRIDAWEDDKGGRCSYDGGDDCHRNETNTTDIRELAYPSNGTYTNTSTWGSTGNHTYYFKCTWKYSGTANLITPSASCQSANVATGAIRSWSVNMTAGTTYAFSNYGSGADTKIRIYNTDGYTIMASNDDNGPHVAGSAASIEYTAPSTGTYYVELSNFDRSELTTNSTLSYWIKPTSIAGFGSNTWNILGYNKSDLALSSNTYVGYYNVNSLSYNTSSGPGIYTNTPTDATGWTGGCVHPDYHTVVAKRQGFPCKIYQLDIPNHDDDIRVFVNGNQVYEHLGCCDNHSNIWTGYLTSTSTIEVRHIDGVGGSNQGLTLTDVTTALNGGSIAGITNGTTICTGGDPGAFTSTASGSGGTIGITNGSPSAETYQWESSTTSSTTGYSNIGGATSTTYDPGALTATTWFRRRVTDACGTVSYSNVIQVVVVADPTAPTATKSPAVATVCAGATLTLTGPTAGAGGTGTCNFEYRYSFDGVGYTSWNTSVPSITAVTGTNYIEIRTNCSGIGCDISPTTSYSWTVAADPTAPTNTPTPSASTVCVGAPLSVSAGGSSGGTGTCTYEYAIDPGTGTFGTWGATNSVTASGIGTYRIKSRMNCNGSGCDISPESAITSWTVVADPSAPTATKSPTDATVCAGQTLTLTSPTLGTGGTGTCNFEYRFNTGGGFSAWGSSVPSFTAVTGTNTIEIRTNCTGNSCDASPASSYSWTVAADPSAPTGMTKSPNDASVCVGATLTVTGAAAGTGGTGTCNVEYRYSTDNGGNYSGWSTSVPSISTVVGTTIIQASTLCTGLGCDRSATSQVSWVVEPDPSAPTATKSPNLTYVCDGEVVTLTNITDNGGGTGTCDIEYALDNGSGSYGSWTTTIPSYTVSAPSGDIRIKMRKNCNGAGCNISNETLYSWDVFTKSTDPISLTPTATYVCDGSTVYLLVNGGSLGNDGSQWYLYDADPNAGGNLLASNASGFFTISNISGTYDYYVRAEGDCGVTNTVNALVVTSAGTDASTYDDCLVSSTTSNTCNVSGSQTHYFVNSSNCEIFQINSNGANLGSTTLTSTVAGNGPVGDGGDFASCDVASGGPGGEYHVERVFNFSSANSPSGANITLTQCITDAEYNNYEGLAAFTDPDYQRCYGTTTTAADLSITCFNSAGNVAYVGSPTYSSKTLGGNTVHCYTFTIASSNLRTRGISESNITAYGDCECYLHSSGGEGGPLPIELTNFTGTYTNNAVRLDWATASEKNNDYFELLRSTDGTNFEVVATLDSKAPFGTSNYVINYEYTDNNVVGGVVYYQLKQTDFDGTTSLSKVVSVEIPQQLLISDFRPNPAKNDVSVKISTTRSTDVQFALVSIDGRRVIENNYSFSKGVSQINVNLSGLASGTYIGEFIIDGIKYNKKLVITQ